MDGLEQTLGMAPGPGVRRSALGGLLDRCGIAFTDRGQSCGQAAAVGGGDVLNAAGKALPEVKALADLPRGPSDDSAVAGIGNRVRV
ncbi:hypothetical protein ACFWTC_35160 [Streptomyces sp. NPDC058619]|uniref:hypothetical protein n=1 Tax=unclassified Streptomyces TaxID=2593676 RepID=UPI003663980C